MNAEPCAATYEIETLRARHTTERYYTFCAHLGCRRGMNDNCVAASVPRCNFETRIDGGCSSFGRHFRQKMIPKLRFTRFLANVSMHRRRLGVHGDLCLLCLVLWPLRPRGGVGRAEAAGKASGESLLFPRGCDAVTLTGTACWLGFGVWSIFRCRRYPARKAELTP